MKRPHARFIIFAAALTAAVLLAEVQAMTNNPEYLNQARKHLQEFETAHDAQQLREAYMAIENVVLVEEHDPQIRNRLRKDTLTVWLRLLRVLDQFVDPDFDPNDEPEDLVQPPPTTGGVIYPPGADPALIDDPKARAEYEAAIAKNRKKIEDYNLQLQLSRLSERISQRADSFIATSWLPLPRSENELKAAIEENIQDPKRKAHLLALIKPRQ